MPAIYIQIIQMPELGALITSPHLSQLSSPIYKIRRLLQMDYELLIYDSVLGGTNQGDNLRRGSEFWVLMDSGKLSVEAASP